MSFPAGPVAPQVPYYPGYLSQGYGNPPDAFPVSGISNPYQQLAAAGYGNPPSTFPGGFPPYGVGGADQYGPPSGAGLPVQEASFPAQPLAPVTDRNTTLDSDNGGFLSKLYSWPALTGLGLTAAAVIYYFRDSIQGLFSGKGKEEQSTQAAASPETRAPSPANSSAPATNQQCGSDSGGEEGHEH